MRAANITALIAVLLWLGLVLLGHDLEVGVASRMGGNVNIGQFDFSVFYPSWVVVGLLGVAWACNTFRRWYWLLTLVAGLALVALAPFLLVYGGGV